MLARVANFALFQALWFACVLGAASGQLALGLAVASGALLLALALSDSRRRDLLLVLALGAGGLALDSLAIAAGVYAAPGARAFPGAAPWWIVMLWAGFATTLCSSFSWSLARPRLATALGAVAGPVAYLSGEALGALTLGEPRLRSLALLAVLWGCALSSAVALARRLNARAPRVRRGTSPAAP